MKVFNRIIVIIDLAASIALLVVMLLSPLETIDLVQYNLGLLADAIQTVPFWTWYLVGSLVVIALFLVLLFFEVWPRRRKSVRIRAQGRGNARIGLDSVKDTLEYRISELEGVNRVVPQLKSRGKDLAVTLKVDSAPGMNVPALSDQIIDLSVRILEGELGLKLRGRMNLDIATEPARPGSLAMRQPVAPAVASPPESVSAAPVVRPEPIVRPTYSAPEPRPTAADAYLDSLSASRAPEPRPEAKQEPAVPVVSAVQEEKPVQEDVVEEQVEEKDQTVD